MAAMPRSVETPRKSPGKSKTPRFRVVSIGDSLPLAHFPVTVGKDHIVQVAPDPSCRHNGITLLSFVFYCYYMPDSPDLQGEI
jgi:hypothetical protein